jgi:PAS domain S-box-containing protein
MSKYWLIHLVIFLAYVSTGYIGLLMPAIGTNVTLMWLPTGIAVGFLYRFGVSFWPSVSAASVLTNLAIGTSLAPSLGIAFGNTAAPLVTVLLLKRFSKFNPEFRRLSDIGRLSLAAHLGMLISASNGVCVLYFAQMQQADLFKAWLCWWAGDSMGVIALTPLLLVASGREFDAIRQRSAEFSGWLALTVVVSIGVFVFNSSKANPAWALAFVPLPCVAWAGLRFGAAGTSLSIIVLSFIATYGTSIESGPFFRKEQLEQVLILWFYMGTVASMGWLIAAIHFAETKVSQLHRLLEEGLREASVGFLLTDIDRRITYASAGFTRLTGFSSAELLGHDCNLLQGPGTDLQTIERMNSSLAASGYFDGEVLNYRKDGTAFWNALQISPILNERMQKIGYLGIQRDITSRREAELSLQQSENRLRTILDLEPECVKLLSVDCRLVEMNPAGLAMIEAPSIEQVRGADVLSLIEPSHRSHFLKMHQQVLAGSNGHCQFPIVGLKGTKRWLETHAVPFRNADGVITGLLSVTRDITSRKSAEDSLRKSEERFRGFVENSSTGFYLYEFDKPIACDLPEDEQVRRLATDGYIALANAAHARMYGFDTGSELVGKRAIDLYQTHDNEANQTFLRNFVRNQYQIKDAHSEEFDRDGKRVVFSNDCWGIVENGFLVRIWGTQRDITEHRRFDLAIRTLLEITASTDLHFEEQLRRILELGCSQFHLEVGSVLRIVDGGLETIQTWPASAEIANPGSIDSGTVASATNSSWSLLKTEISFANTPCGILQFAGTAKPGMESSLLDQHLLTLMARWIGSQMQIQTTLSHRQAIVDNSPDYILTIDRYHRIVFLNRLPNDTGAPLLRLGAILTDIIHPSSRVKAEECLAAVWRTGIPGKFDSLYQLDQQRNLYFEARVTPIIDGKKMSYLLVTASDVTASREAELQLKENRDRLNGILNSIQDVVYSSTPNGESMLFISNHCQDIYGVLPHAFLSDPMLWLALIHEDDKRLAATAFDQLRDSGSFAMEYRIVRPDGEIRWVLDRGRLVYDDHGVSTRLDGVVSDITDRKNSEEQLKASEQRYRALFKQNPQPMWVYDLETLQFLAVNNAAIEHYGYSRDEFLQMTIKDIRPSEDIPRLLQSVEKQVPGLDKAGVWRHRTKRGDIIRVEITSHAQEFDGRPAELILAYDVTERKLLEEQIYASQQRFQAIVEKSHDLILIIDRDGTIQFANPASEEVLGTRPEELIGRKDLPLQIPAQCLPHPDENQRFDSSLPQEFRTEFRTRHQDGSWRTIEAVGINLLDMPALSGIVVNCRDITERKERELRTATEHTFFEMLINGAPLKDILKLIAEGAELLSPGMHCSILLLDESGQRVRSAAAPSLPDTYCRAIDGLAIGPQAGSCGTAAFRRERVITVDIVSDPLWVNYRDIARAHGLRACWSLPLISSQDKVLGTLAMYFTEPREPTHAELLNIDRAAHFAVVAIEREEMLESLRDSQIRLETLISNLPGMAYRCKNDPDWTMSFVSIGCQSVTGYDRGELLNNSLVAYASLIHQEDQEWLWNKCQAALAERVPCSNTYRIIDKDGQIRWVQERASGVYDKDGCLKFIDGFIQDVTEARRIEEQMIASLREKEAMLKEIHHRVKNNLQIVTSLLNLQLDRITDPTVISELRESQNRVRSMALVHETLYLSGNLGRINLSEYVDALSRHLFRSFGARAAYIQLELDVANVDLDLERAIPFGLIINELISNALKYAFPDGRTGRICISLQQTANHFELVFSDDGVGFAEATKIGEVSTLGLRLVRDLVQQLNGTLQTVSGTGVLFQIVFPINREHRSRLSSALSV